MLQSSCQLPQEARHRPCKAGFYSGPDSFTYTAEDSSGLQSTSTVYITVTPTATNDARTTPANTPLSGTPLNGTGVLHYIIGWATPFRMPEFFLISGLFLGQVIARPWVAFADRLGGEYAVVSHGSSHCPKARILRACRR